MVLRSEALHTAKPDWVCGVFEITAALFELAISVVMHHILRLNIARHDVALSFDCLTEHTVEVRIWTCFISFAIIELVHSRGLDGATDYYDQEDGDCYAEADCRAFRHREEIRLVDVSLHAFLLHSANHYLFSNFN